jgi:hypothetical protein
MRYRLETTHCSYTISERRRVARAWNASADEVVNWPKVRSAIPADGRYMGPAWEDYPVSLRHEVERHLGAMIRQPRVRAPRPSGTCSAPVPFRPASGTSLRISILLAAGGVGKRSAAD